MPSKWAALLGISLGQTIREVTRKLSLVNFKLVYRRQWLSQKTVYISKDVKNEIVATRCSRDEDSFAKSTKGETSL